MAQNSIERAIAKQQQEAKRLYDKQQREARKNAEKDERRQRASMIVNGQPINYGMRIMDKSAEEILELILSVYDGAETRFVKGSQDVFPEAYQQSMALEFEKLSMYGMITGHRIWVTGFWELYITPQGLTYFEDKEKSNGYYRLEKDFEGDIELEGSEEGFTPISGETGRREKKKDPLTVIIDKVNERYGTTFTEMDKVLLQIENDYASKDKWKNYAKNNDFKTFMLLFAKDFPEVAAGRYEQNDDFFVRMFNDPEMMKQIMDTIGSALYEKLKKQ